MRNEIDRFAIVPVVAGGARLYRFEIGMEERQAQEIKMKERRASKD